ncbi:MAG: hypothetical protein H7A05_07675 [Pseudomonadales bacterium]|nr:hypothetical protein [Pseudomonadales bacterium]
MKDRYVIDTNILIAASAVHAAANGMPLPHHREVTPQEPALQQRICAWLSAFEQSGSHLVLDVAGGINAEYHHKLDFNDYGIQVVMNKISRSEVDLVPVAYDDNGDGIVPQPLDEVVRDLADRKMLAAALEALKLPGSSAIAFAGDTDWLDWEAELIRTGLVLEPVVEEWSRAKHEEKQHRRHMEHRHE